MTWDDINTGDIVRFIRKSDTDINNPKAKKLPKWEIGVVYQKADSPTGGKILMKCIDKDRYVIIIIKIHKLVYFLVSEKRLDCLLQRLLFCRS